MAAQEAELRAEEAELRSEVRVLPFAMICDLIKNGKQMLQES